MSNLPYHQLTVKEVIRRLESDPENGLNDSQVEQRKKKFGLNQPPKEQKLSKTKIFFEQFRNPLVYILLVSGLITALVKQFHDTLIILGATMLDVVVGFLQENKTANVFEKISQAIKAETTVVREGKKKIIPQEELVPGDIIFLKEGSRVPADGRIIEAENLTINEAALTGEWLAVTKTTSPVKGRASLGDRDNIAYTGTIIESGQGKAVVIATGKETQLGQIAQKIKETKEEKTPYQKKIAHFSRIISAVIIILALLITVEGLIAQDNPVIIISTAIAIAVSAIPEGLPAAITIILAVGMQRILSKKGLVRKLVAAETLGSTQVILTDKTCTLTKGEMKLAKIYPEENEELSLSIAITCGEAFIEKNHDRRIIRGTPTEKAILTAANDKGIRKELKIVKRIPFDSFYKYSAAVIKKNRHYYLYLTGAPEMLLEKCQKIDKGRPADLSASQREKITQVINEMAGRGERIVATAYKKLDKNIDDEEMIRKTISQLTFVGLISLEDPLREDAQASIKQCQKAGLTPIIVTGDHQVTAKTIAKKLGLPCEKENIITGPKLDQLSDTELTKAINRISVYARIAPQQKMRLVEAWQKQGAVVAMVGDGINDSLALKKADIGIAIGSGTDVAKQIADLILLDNSFSVIVRAIEEGRAIVDNMKKVITYLLSDSFTEVILVTVAIFMGLPLPVTAAQILWINLIEDGLPDIALAFEPKEKDLLKRGPIPPNQPLLDREMRIIIFLIGLFTDLFTLAFFYYLIKNTGYTIDHIRSVIFAALAIDSLLFMFSCKSLRHNINHIRVFNNKLLVGAFAGGVILLLTALYVPLLQNLLKTNPLNGIDWLMISIIGIINLLMIELAKYLFIHKILKNKV